MKGAPMMGNTKSHGTNKNYKMSGMTNTDGTAGGPPFLGKAFKAIGGALTGKGKAGMFINPLGHLARKAFGRKRNQPVDPNAAAAAAAQAMPVDPTTSQPIDLNMAQADPNAAVDPAAMEDPNAQVA